MPLYEYTCRQCSRDFEALVRASDTPSCPSCQSDDLQRKLSVFAAHTAGGNGTQSAMPAVGPCGSCGDPRGPGACSLN
jgi:putative FmdB family regulatory protein